MGLVAKFVPTPRTDTTKKKVMHVFERFECDLGWKMFRAGNKQDFVKSKMYVKSTRPASLPPPKIDSGVNFFKILLRKLLSHCPRSRSNLSKIQEKILSLRRPRKD